MATGSRSIANYTTGVADRYLATRDVPNDDTACSDHRVVPDSNPGADHAVTAYPYIASNVHGLRRFQATAPGLRMTRMQSGIDVHARTDLRIRPDGYEVAVEEDTAKIHKAVLTDSDVHAVIAGEWRAQLHPIPDSVQQFAQACVPSGGILVGNSIKSSQPSLRVGHGLLQFRVG
jgi:hypothetical protein